MGAAMAMHFGPDGPLRIKGVYEARRYAPPETGPGPYVTLRGGRLKPCERQQR